MNKEVFLTPQQHQRVEELKQMSPTEWESLCKQCGICCLYKAPVDGQTAYLSKSCQYLNKETKQCEIYKDRLTRRGTQCEKVTLDIILDGQLTPRTCGYVEYIYGPAPEQIHLDWSIIKKHEPGIPMTPKDIITESVLWNHR